MIFFFVFSSAVFLKKYNVRISLFVYPHIGFPLNAGISACALAITPF